MPYNPIPQHRSAVKSHLHSPCHSNMRFQCVRNLKPPRINKTNETREIKATASFTKLEGPLRTGNKPRCIDYPTRHSDGSNLCVKIRSRSDATYRGGAGPSRTIPLYTAPLTLHCSKFRRVPFRSEIQQSSAHSSLNEPLAVNEISLRNNLCTQRKRHNSNNNELTHEINSHKTNKQLFAFSR